MYLCMYLCMDMCVCMYLCHSPNRECARLRERRHVCIYIYTYTYIHTQIHTRMHTYICVSTLTPDFIQFELRRDFASKYVYFGLSVLCGHGLHQPSSAWGPLSLAVPNVAECSLSFFGLIIWWKRSHASLNAFMAQMTGVGPDAEIRILVYFCLLKLLVYWALSY